MIALDTNVLTYAYDRSDPTRQRIALDIVSYTNDGVILWPVACEASRSPR